MSNSPAEQTSEKSNFTRKVSLLSQYLKEKGSFGDINFELARKPDSSLGFAGKPEPRGHESGKMTEESSEVKTFDLIKKLSAAEGPPPSAGDTAKEADLSEPASVPEPGPSQLTIFFNGKVIVFDEFPVSKAQEIMEMAKQANPGISEGLALAVGPNSVAEDNDDNNNNKNNNSNNYYYNSNNCGNSDNDNNNNSNNYSNGNTKGNGNGDAVIPDLNEPTNSGNDDGNQKIQHQLVERIARRASLHRFFAKRKERATARAPYQVNQNARLPPKPEEASRRPDQGQSSRQLENDAVDIPKLEEHTDKLPEEKEEDVRMKDLELRL